jgi:DNA-binding CsgD family transcriptional regulator
MRSWQLMLMFSQLNALSTEGRGRTTRGRVSMDERLTARELEVLKLVCEGYSTKEIATILHVSAKTVAGHRSMIFAKAGVHNAVRLLRWAIERGYVSVEPPHQQ